MHFSGLKVRMPEAWMYFGAVDLAKGYHLMTYSPTGVEATAVELQDSTRTLCRRNCKLYRLRSA